MTYSFTVRRYKSFVRFLDNEKRMFMLLIGKDDGD